MATAMRNVALALAGGSGGGGGGGGGGDDRLAKAIELLRKSRLELIEEIRRECDANPLATHTTEAPDAR